MEEGVFGVESGDDEEEEEPHEVDVGQRRPVAVPKVPGNLLEEPSQHQVHVVRPRGPHHSRNSSYCSSLPKRLNLTMLYARGSQLATEFLRAWHLVKVLHDGVQPDNTEEGGSKKAFTTPFACPWPMLMTHMER